MQQGKYEEKLPTGGTLIVTDKDWYIQYYFPGPDLRYNGTFCYITDKNVDDYIVALKYNFKKYLDMQNSFSEDCKLTIDTELNMTIVLNGSRGGGLHMFHSFGLICTQDDLHDVIRDLIYAKKKAISIQNIFREGNLNAISLVEILESQDNDLDGYYETLVLIKNEFYKFYSSNLSYTLSFDEFWKKNINLFATLHHQLKQENKKAHDIALEKLFDLLSKARKGLGQDSVKKALDIINFSKISPELFEKISSQLYDILEEKGTLYNTSHKQAGNNYYHIIFAYLIYQIFRYGSHKCKNKLMLNLKNITPGSGVAILRYTELMYVCRRYGLTPLPIDIPEVNLIPMPSKPQKTVKNYRSAICCVFITLIFMGWLIISLQEENEFPMFQFWGMLFFSFLSLIGFRETSKKYQNDIANYNLAIENLKDYQLQVYTNRKFAELHNSKR